MGLDFGGNCAASTVFPRFFARAPLAPPEPSARRMAHVVAPSSRSPTSTLVRSSHGSSMSKTSTYTTPPASSFAASAAQRTLTGGARKKQKRKLHRELLLAADDAAGAKKQKKHHSRVAESTTTRKLFAGKSSGDGESSKRVAARKSLEESARAACSSSSSSSSASSSSSENDGSSSESECEVSFDAVTLGNMRVVREAQSPMSTSSTSSGASAIGVEYRFNVSSTVSSMAIAPNGQFLVVGFNNGTIYLYPLNQDALRFRNGVLLDHITARGMYTQLMVKVAIPDDGKFIFAGVYRGSTEIRAVEVDSIVLPSLTTCGHNNSRAFQFEHDRDDSSSDEDDDDQGLPTAQAVTHTYSDAKLRGFGAVKSIELPSSSQNEYQLLCGLGIKNIHIWRFFLHPRSKSWQWECVFDKQTNGISVEFVAFHRSNALQIISKSQHQNIRVWTLDEEASDAQRSSLKLHKKKHVDIKHTVDTVAVFGDHAYGGSDALALIDLRSGSRSELSLPLSVQEEDAKQEALRASKSLMSSLRATRNARSSRRGGGGSGADGSSRLMRTVTQVSGLDHAPFSVGMCSDGSVFFHQPRDALGMDTPLEYVEGYEAFFRDPSLSFQAQFSDLTRVNACGSLAVLGMPTDDDANAGEKWMIAAANDAQLMVRSLTAFLGRNQRQREIAQVQQGLRHVLRDLGGAESSASSSSSDSEPEAEPEAAEEEPTKQSAPANKKRSPTKKQPPASSSKDDDKENEPERLTVATPRILKVVGASALAMVETPKAVSTPPRRVRAQVATPVGRSEAAMTASPVVSVTDSCSSNPNTPIQGMALKKTTAERLQALKALQWTPDGAASQLAEEDEQLMSVLPKGIPPRSVQDGAKKRKKNRASTDDAGATTAPAGKEKARRKAREVANALLSVDVNEKPEEKAPSPAPSSSPVQGPTKSPLSVAQFEESNGGDLEEGEVEEGEIVPSPVKAPVPAMNAAAQAGSMSPVETSSKVLNLPKTTEAEPKAVAMDQELTEPAAVASLTSDADGSEEDPEEEEEDEFLEFPLASDGSSLLAATCFKYKETSSDAQVASMSTDAPAVDRKLRDTLMSEQTVVLTRFAQQHARLRASFEADKQRLLREKHQTDCRCDAVRKASGCTKGWHWKKNVANDFQKKKQLKRKCRKQFVVKSKQLQTTYRQRVDALLRMQRLEAGACHARQQFQHLYQQLSVLPSAVEEMTAVHPYDCS